MNPSLAEAWLRFSDSDLHGLAGVDDGRTDETGQFWTERTHALMLEERVHYPAVSRWLAVPRAPKKDYFHGAITRCDGSTPVCGSANK